MPPRSDDLAAALVARAGALPETAAVLARLVIDAAYGPAHGDPGALPAPPTVPIPELIEKFRVAYPAMFVPAAPPPPAVPADETVTARVNREGREADARAVDADPWESMPVTRAVMLKAGRP